MSERRNGSDVGGQLDDMTEPELRRIMTAVARAVEAQLPRGVGFVVLAADFGADPGTAQYVANASRQDCIRWLRETADRLEARDDVPR